MLNVIPRFIQRKITGPEAENSGRFSASVMFVDIVGFTAISENLMKHGKQNAEELSILINKVYRPLIDIVYGAGGFVANFAGDSITAIFTGNSSDATFFAATSIKKHFEKHRKYYSRFSDGFEIESRIGLSAGLVSWIVFGEELRAFCFYGDPVLESSLLTSGKDPGEITASSHFIKTPGDTDPSRKMLGVPFPKERIRRTLGRLFVPERVLNTGNRGEFRNVTSLFISFKWKTDLKLLKELVNYILLRTDEFGGYFGGPFYDVKGPHALIVFGAPISYENNVERAADLAILLKERFGTGIKAGISSGSVYAGIMGSSRRCTYTVLGDAVNLAARIMQISDWGQILAVSNVAEAVTPRYEIVETGSETVKGKTQSVKMFEILGSPGQSHDTFFEGKMVGRERELRLLTECCETARSGSFAGVVYIYGGAGIGKSRLVYELLHQLPVGMQYMIMRTDGILRKGFNPFTYLLEKYFRQNDSNSEQRKLELFDDIWKDFLKQLNSIEDEKRLSLITTELNRTRSLLSAMLGHHQEQSLYTVLDARGRFDNTIFALKEFIKAQSLLAPAVLVLEDIHWLDTDSKEALKTITRNVEDYPFMIIAPSRLADDGSKPRLDLDIEVPVTEILLEPLGSANENNLIKTRLNGKPDSELTEFIIERTEGNPFYIEQFCFYLQENELLELREGKYYLLNHDVDIPPGINSVIVSRIDRLSHRLKELVQTASVLGREFDIQVLSAMLRGKTDRLDPLLSEGENQAIWTAATEISYIFKHAILRDTVYRMQLRRRLRRLHKTAAEAMEVLFVEDTTRYTDIAYHYENSGDRNKAGEYLRKAADLARDEYRNSEALDLYGRLLESSDSAADKIVIEMEIADILVLLGEWDEAEHRIMRNLEKANEHDFEPEKALCCKTAATLFYRQGKNAEASEYVTKARIIMNNLNDTKGIGIILNVLGNINTVLGNYEDALGNFEASNESARLAGDYITIALNISNIGNVYLYQYRLDEAEKYYIEAIRECRKIGEKRAMANTINNLAIVHYYRGELKKSQDLLDQYIDLSKELGDKEGLAYILGNVGVLRQEMGDYEAALSFYNRQLQLSEELGDASNLAISKRQIGQIQRIRGDFENAEKNIKESINISEHTGESRNYAMSIRDLGEVYLDSGKYDKAREMFGKAIVISDGGTEKDVAASSRMHLSAILAKSAHSRQVCRYIEEAVAIKREIEEPALLSACLVKAAEIYLNMGLVKDAGDSIREAVEIAEDDKSADSNFTLRLIENLVIAEENAGLAVKGLENLKKTFSDNEEYAARVNFELYFLTGKKEYQTESIKLYEKLYRTVRMVNYREKLDRLTEGIERVPLFPADSGSEHTTD